MKLGVQQNKNKISLSASLSPIPVEFLSHLYLCSVLRMRRTCKAFVCLSFCTIQSESEQLNYSIELRIGLHISVDNLCIRMKDGINVIYRGQGILSRGYKKGKLYVYILDTCSDVLNHLI